MRPGKFSKVLSTAPAYINDIRALTFENAARLLQALNQVTLSGEMPSFGDAGARSGYIQKRFAARSSSVAAILLHPGLGYRVYG